VTARWELSEEAGVEDPACMGPWQWQDGTIKVHQDTILGPVVATATGSGRNGSTSWTMPTPLPSEDAVYVAEYVYHVSRDQSPSYECAWGVEPMPREHSVNAEFTLPSWDASACTFALRSGKAGLSVPGRAQSITMKRGDGLSSGMTIVTGLGRAELRSADGSLLRIGPHSKLTMTDEYCTQRPKFSFKVLFGRVWAKITHLGGPTRFTVETTNAVTGVRGTVFQVDARTRGGKPLTVVKVFKGTVAVTNKKGRHRVQRLVRSGRVTRVVGSAAPTRP